MRIVVGGGLDPLAARKSGDSMESDMIPALPDRFGHPGNTRRAMFPGWTSAMRSCVASGATGLGGRVLTTSGLTLPQAVRDR